MKQFSYRLSAVNWHSRIKLPFLVSARVRIAEIATVPTVQIARGFPCGRWDELAAYQPHVLVGTQSELQLVLDEIEKGRLDLSTVDRALVVLTYTCNALLDDVFRVRLWQAFGVPVYELLIGPNSTLMAAECEAHEGWHVQPEAEISFHAGEIRYSFRSNPVVQTGWAGRLEMERCPCGRDSARLVGLERVSRQTQRKFAATA
ncbi:MAG: hypothetical protein JO270_23250 [Acidobacteriaceae bacterium]|nr:hypothetical protein [Acidobacteriaceae bacterium]